MKISKKRKRAKAIFCIILAVIVISGAFGVFKSLPQGLSYRSEEYKTDDVSFVCDLTYEKDGERIHEQAIFENIYEIIENAGEFIVCDMFLFNDLGAGAEHLSLSSDLTDRLIEKKLRNKDMEIMLITDPINTVYGAYETESMKRLTENGIKVVVTDLRKLKDSNPIYSSIDRVLLRFIKTGIFPPYLPNAFGKDGPKVRMENYFELVNFKANHRKTVTSEKETLITSANPHDASSLHSNIAFRIRGDFAAQVYKSEESVAVMSGENPGITSREGDIGDGQYAVTLLTEKKIKDEIISGIDSLEQGDRLDILVFYLSDRDIAKAIKKAIKRGAAANLVLDANKDAFGMEKNGIPNRQLAYELSKAGANIRWYKTNGEQFHTKMAVFQSGGEMKIIGGSANFTRRNLNDLNLETDVMIKAPSGSGLAREINQYIEKINQNTNGVYTVDFEKYEETSKMKWVVYWMQEATGLCTF